MAMNIFFLAYAENEIESCLIPTSVENLDWFSDEAKEYIDKKDGIWKRGISVIMIDVESGIYFNASRNGGDNHSDFEPETKEDTEKLKEIYGGKWSWDKRSVIVLIGNKAFAASISGMPHGGNRIKENKFGGHTCCHFLNSRFHSNNKPGEKHQEYVQNAYDISSEKLSDLLTNIE